MHQGGRRRNEIMGSGARVWEDGGAKSRESALTLWAVQSKIRPVGPRDLCQRCAFADELHFPWQGLRDLTIPPGSRLWPREECGVMANSPGQPPPLICAGGVPGISATLFRPAGSVQGGTQS